MRKYILFLFFLPSVLFANDSYKKVYSSSRFGTVTRDKSSLLDEIILSHTLDEIVESTESKVLANRKVVVSSPHLLTKGKVIDVVDVSKKGLLDFSKSHMKSGLKSGIYGAALSVLSSIAIEKGWEWIEEQRSWVRDDTVFPTLKCNTSHPQAGLVNETMENKSAEYCFAIQKQRVLDKIASEPPNRWQILSEEPIVIVSPTKKQKVIHLYFPGAFNDLKVTLTADGTGTSSTDKVPVTDKELSDSVESKIKGNESSIVSNDISNGLRLPYPSTEQFSSEGNEPAFTPEEVVSTTNKTNPDGTTETTTKKEQTRYDYKPSGSSPSSITPTATTITTTTTVNNTTNQTTIIRNELKKSPEEVKKEEEEESPPNAPPPEFPEIEEPKLDETKIPAIVTNTMMGFPMIPTEFSCTDPTFDAYYVQFSLPMCQWIDRFRFLFHWFWLVTTGIAIYLLATSTKVGAK